MEDNQISSEQWSLMWEEATLQLEFWLSIKDAVDNKDVTKLNEVIEKYEDKEV